LASRRLRAVTLHVEGTVEGVGGSEGCVELGLLGLLPLPMLLVRTAAEEADLGLRLGCLGWIMGGPGTARGAGTGKGGMIMGCSLFSVAGVGGAFWQVYST
jgi:hypothetical protein